MTIIKEKAEDVLKRELRPEFVRKMLNLKRRGEFRRYSSLKDLHDKISKN